METKESAANRLAQIKHLRDVGLFRDALTAFNTAPPDLTNRLSAQVLKAELLERIGYWADSERIINRVLASRTLSADDRSLCDLVLARIRIEHGDFEDAVVQLNKCISTSRRAGNVERLGFAQLKQLTLLSDGLGADAAGPLAVDVHRNAVRCGSPFLLCAVHVYFAQLEALRGSVSSSMRHVRLASTILAHSPNVWLESVLENIQLALAIMSSQLDAAQLHASRAFALVAQTGGAAERAVTEGNSGFVFYMLGELDKAIECYERTLELSIEGSQNYSGTLDSIARVKLAQRRFDESESLLARVDEVGKGRNRETYVYRHAQLTRAQLYLRKGDVDAALATLNHVFQLAKKANDRLLEVSALITAIEAEACRQNMAEIRKLVEQITICRDMPADMYGSFESAVALACIAAGDDVSARDHFRRAERIFGGLNNAQALTGLQSTQVSTQLRDSQSETNSVGACAVLQSAVLALSQAQHPEVTAREIAFVVWTAGIVHSVKAVSCLKNGQERVLVHFGKGSVDAAREKPRRVTVGHAMDRAIDLLVEPKSDVNSLVTFHAAVKFIELAGTLKNLVDERNERVTIWPPDEFPQFDGNTVISGHLRDQVKMAQRVARTRVNVLITGESGTGKEILARAIHDFSDRAQKPFVPLNCAAVPRELLESQLFGHRRGAFTGAERDHLGVIRSADGGSLFLDEVGELSLELQPKLLRFLESGEISPLGEPSPLTVNVRVIAATNSNLDDAVRDGRFREDLFYRLNVVNLSLLPLRERRDEIPALVRHFVDAAASEYNKGRLEVAEETLERLLLYRWPGNVRQLQNEIRRMVALAEPNSTLQPDAISAEILRAMLHLPHVPVNGREIAVSLQAKLMPTLERIECEMIKAALRDNHGRLQPAAKSLGISRKGLYLKRQRLGL